MNAHVLKVRGMERAYPGFHLGPIDIDLAPGTVTALVGPNGAGKTTTLRCVVGLTRPDKGSVEINGRKGFVGDGRGFFERATVSENLQVVSRFHERWSESFVSEISHRLALPMGKRVYQLSKGGRAKLALVAALGHRPELLLLDEPLEGLDPLARTAVLDTLRELQETDAHAIVFCTHVLSDVSRIADELVFLKDGKIVTRASPVELTDSWRRISFRRAGAGEEQLVSEQYERTLEHLRDLGAENVEALPMSVEEIAVEILKEQASDVVIDKS